MLYFCPFWEVREQKEIKIIFVESLFEKFERKVLHELFSSSGFKDKRILRIFLFLTVLTYFSSTFFEIFEGDSP